MKRVGILLEFNYEDLEVSVYVTLHVAGPRAWNTLPDFITDCSSSRTFKQYLKTYLFSLSF